MVTIEEKYSDLNVEELKYLAKLTYHIKDYNKCKDIFRILGSKSRLKIDREDQYLFSACLKQIIKKQITTLEYMKKVHLQSKEEFEKIKQQKQKEDNQDTVTKNNNDIEKNRNELKLSFLQDKINLYENDIKRTIDEMNTLIDDMNKKLAYSQNDEKMFFMKLRGDLLRYKSGLYKYKEDRSRCISQCEKCYLDAIDFAHKNKIQYNNPTLLSIQLNYAVMLYEIKYEKDNSISYLKETLSNFEAIKKIEDIDANDIVKLMRQNLFIWEKDTAKPQVINYQEKGYEDDIYS